MPVATYQIQDSKADAREEQTTGDISYTFQTIAFGSTRRYTLLRFINIDIPQGSTINSAILSFKANSHSGTPPDIVFAAEKSPNPPIVTTTAFNISTRTLTTTTVTWTSPVFTDGAWNDSPEVKSIIQEIINQTSWERGNPINIITNVGVTTSLNYNLFYAFDFSPAQAATLEIDYTIPASEVAEQGKVKQKDFLYKIYNSSGTYLTTWSVDVVNTPSFLWKMNGGMGDLNIQLKRSLKDFGESDDVAFGNIIKCYIQDGDQERGKKIWEGKINRYEPETTSDGTEVVNVVATSRLLEMEKRLVKSGSNTEVTFSSVDPADILRSLISMPSAGGILLKGSVDNTSTTVSYTFQANTIREGFDVVVKLSPQYWYWWLDADNQINFKIANFEEVNHRIYIGKEVSNVRLTKSIENLCNRVYFMGGGSPNMYHMYERTSSQTEWGLREVFLKDERVTVDATASLIANSYLDNFDHPISEIEIEVVDSNIDPINGYDIERFKPGDIVRVLHPEMEKRNTEWDTAYWDVDYWDFDIRYALGQPHQILEIRYGFNSCVLKLAQKLEDFQKRIEDVRRNLEETAKINLPAVPT